MDWREKYLNKVTCGDCLSVLRDIPDGAVNCIITSPPYWGLRDYGLPPQIWDGRDGCEHEWGNQNGTRNIGRDDGYYGGKTGFGDMDSKQKKPISSQFCSLCGAWRGSLGLEPTYQLYLDHLMQVMAECKRVLRDDGTMWVNIGDSYAGSGKGIGTDRNTCKESYTDDDIAKTDWKQVGIPAKSLVGIPERFAIRMTDDLGMIRRNTIIWYKRNCMPSSVKDRFTVDFEPVYFFVKQGKYWFEQQKEPMTPEFKARIKRGWEGNGERGYPCGVQNHFGKYFNKNDSEAEQEYAQGRNRRCVWDIPTRPFPGSHFAVFPETLVEPMILAGCPEFICNKCGKAREKIIERKRLKRTDFPKGDPRYRPNTYNGAYGDINGKADAGYTETKVVGITDCGCNAGYTGGIVLDPFMGAGTTGIVATKHGRSFIGIELNHEYANMATRRIAQRDEQSKIPIPFEPTPKPEQLDLI